MKLDHLFSYRTIVTTLLAVIGSMLLTGCPSGGGDSQQNNNAPPADTYFSLAVTENSHNHTGARLLFLDFQNTANTSTIQNNVIISPEVTSGNIILDGDSSDWNSAQFSTVNGLPQNNYPLSEFIDSVPTDITVGSAWDNTYIYFIVQWIDAGHTQSTKLKKWIYGNQGGGETGWNPKNHIGVTVGAPNENAINAAHTLAGSENEDRILFMFPITDSEGRFAEDGLGCAAYCHPNLSIDNPNQNYTGDGVVTMHTTTPGNMADIWHWKALRTGGSGFADDKHIDYATGSNNGRIADSGSSAYTSNVLNVSDNPTSMHPGGLSNTDDILSLSIAVAFSGSPTTGDEIPSILGRSPTGSRGDVESSASYDSLNNRWTVEFRRLRNTGNSDDRQFVSGTNAQAPIYPAVVSADAGIGSTLYIDSCETCHGANGVGVVGGSGWSFPRIQRTSGSLILHALEEVPAMSGIQASLGSTPQEIEQAAENIAAYLQTEATFVTTNSLTVTINGTTTSGAVTSSMVGIDCPTTCTFDQITGTSVMLIANTMSGYLFNSWGGACSGTISTCDITLSSDLSVTANYDPVGTNYTLTVTPDVNGTVTDGNLPTSIDCGSDCTEAYADGSTVTLTATPISGYQFDGWSGAGCSGTGPCVFVINADITVSTSYSSIDCGAGVIFDTGGTNGYGYELAVNTGAVSSPTDISFIPNTGNAFLVTSQSGTVYYFNGGCDPVNSLVLGDVGITVITGGEQGLLNVEFHPDYGVSNNYVFFYHTSVSNNTNSISRATLSFDGSGNMVLGDTVKIIDFSKNISASNHDGGGLVFAPDGTLLASVGDGGSGGSGNGQLDTNLLGVVVRINPSLVTAVSGYTIPASGNMFANTNSICSGVATSADPCPEILAMGLRNPFRMSMAGNIVYLGDVGSGVEEINSFDYTIVNTSSPVNFGWAAHDGHVSSSTIPGYRNPIVYYNRSGSTADAFRAEDPEGSETGSASIMIGDVCTGTCYGGELLNKLFFAEFYDGFMRAVGVDGNGNITDGDGVPGMHIIHHGQVSSMVEGPDGYMYFTTLYSPSMVYRLVKP